ncbi:hypothetical protein HYU92_00340 [Candidatus Curtissbacteria bacterium]|nr:hypothetical protein [Candidatus Curtissbacteria bacterium]
MKLEGILRPRGQTELQVSVAHERIRMAEIKSDESWLQLAKDPAAITFDKLSSRLQEERDQTTILLKIATWFHEQWPDHQNLLYLEHYRDQLNLLEEACDLTTPQGKLAAFFWLNERKDETDSRLETYPVHNGFDRGLANLSSLWLVYNASISLLTEALRQAEVNVGSTS